MDYTIHNVSDELDAAVQARAAKEQKSVDVVLIEALSLGLGLPSIKNAVRDLSDVAGQCTIDDDTRAAFEDQRQIDPELWN